MDIDPEMVAYIITIILSVISAYVAKQWNTTKNKLHDITNLATKLAAALKTTSEAIEDDKVTSTEEKELVKRWKDVIEQGKNLLEW